MLMNYLKSFWKHVKLPLRHQLSISNNKAFLNLPINIDKETPMQIEDKVVLSDVNDAVAVATFKLNLTPAILFQSKCVNLIEQLSTYKNVFLVYFYLEKNYVKKTNICLLVGVGGQQWIGKNNFGEDGNGRLSRTWLLIQLRTCLHQQSKQWRDFWTNRSQHWV